MIAARSDEPLDVRAVKEASREALSSVVTSIVRSWTPNASLGWQERPQRGAGVPRVDLWSTAQAIEIVAGSLGPGDNVDNVMRQEDASAARAAVMSGAALVMTL